MVLCVGGHYRNALQAITSGRQMAQEVRSNLQDTSAFQVLRLVNRGLGRWESTTASDLVPGDVFRIGHNQSTTVIPVDALLLQGQCLVNEAILTGESVPQIKHQLNFDEELTSDPNIRLDMEGRHRMSVLFAGTDLIHVPNSLELTTEDHCVTCMALRTGTYSSKGKLLKSLRNNNQMGEISNAQSEMDAMRVVCVMSFVGLSSCLSIFIRGENSKIARVSPFRRVVQCTRILLASIPSGLPYALSAVTRSCSHKLRTDSDVTCSQPGSLLTAAAVDTVLFDKVCKVPFQRN
jgi:cation-transporting ATPase 13A1